jgi:valyl-tRNA synthetase
VSPFLTAHIYNKIFKKDILKEIIFEEKYSIKEEDNELAECFFLVTKNLRKLNYSKEGNFYLELFSNTEYGSRKKKEFSQLIQKIFKINFSVINNKNISNEFYKNKDEYSFFDIRPFGTVFYENVFNDEELIKKLSYYKSELERCNNLLSHESFMRKAKQQVVDSEKKKRDYYNYQILKTTEKIEKNKIKKKNNI